MTFAGVPILDWVLLIVLLGFGLEAYLTTRPSARSKQKCDRTEAAEQPSERPPD